MCQARTAVFGSILGIAISSVVFAGAYSGNQTTNNQPIGQLFSSDIFSAALPATETAASHGVVEDIALDETYWKELKQKTELVDELAFIPVILPVLMTNRDALQLTDEQIAHFMDWRENNLASVLKTSSLIVQKRLELKKATFDPSISETGLLAMQNEIFDLHRKVMSLKLSCRTHMMTTFTEEQWDNFSFILSDHPKFASLIN